jgi:hypothetical protein
MNRRPVGRAVVGDEALDGDAVASVERDRSAQEADRGRGSLVGEHFDIGQASRVIDSDVHGLPAADVASMALSVGAARAAVAAPSTGDPLAGAAFDAAERLDVDVDQLARPLALVADRGLQHQTTELAHPVALEDRADRRTRHVEQIRELRSSEPQPPPAAAPCAHRCGCEPGWEHSNDRADRGPHRPGSGRPTSCRSDRSLRPLARPA